MMKNNRIKIENTLSNSGLSDDYRYKNSYSIIYVNYRKQISTKFNTVKPFA